MKTVLVPGVAWPMQPEKVVFIGKENPTTVKVYNYLTGHPRSTTADIMMALGSSRSFITASVAKLVSLEVIRSVLIKNPGAFRPINHYSLVDSTAVPETVPPAGHGSRPALTCAQVIEIRKARAKGMQYSFLESKYMVSRTLLSAVIHGRGTYERY